MRWSRQSRRRRRERARGWRGRWRAALALSQWSQHPALTETPKPKRRLQRLQQRGYIVPFALKPTLADSALSDLRVVVQCTSGEQRLVKPGARLNRLLLMLKLD